MAVLAHSNIWIMGLHPARGTDYIHVFTVEGDAVSEVNSIAEDQKSLSSPMRGKRSIKR
jgi:hypothetical protein